MSPAPILAVPPCVAGVFLGSVSLRLWVPRITAGAPSIFVIIALTAGTGLHLIAMNIGSKPTAADRGSESPFLVAALPVLAAVVFVRISTLLLRADRG